MDTLRSIESFVKAIEGGSIAAGARMQGITPAAASQNIQRLETSLNARLLTRTTRSLALTEAGEIYYAKVRHVVSDIENAKSLVTEFHGEPQGKLRIASSAAFGRHVLSSIIPSFTALYPKLSIELILTDQNIDHVKEDIDISIRFKQQLELGLVARKIATVPVLFCASPTYIARKGQPHTPEDLQLHDCLMFRMPTNGRLLSWGFLRDELRFEADIKPSIISNDINSLAELAIAGAGITRLSAFIANPLIKDGKLVALFEQEIADTATVRSDNEPLEFYACFRDHHAMTLKVKAFVSHIMTFIPNTWEST
ncbi:MAG: LysR family transcriptional regulator [Methylotenera sp.]|uniref:LysR family transcriptional regulator n=1 Tax=Methylotenera sp. TaxID=2051956 RepID=UPI000D47193D|nr:LysR family transcriptional regulator [Methylotenera sp.]MDP3776183.1 LysR family transcriptional regulator [Methylotenera sp.]PPC96532.1 MAG: LysR family transcriptional regulator [Methylotenera sp.]